MTTLYNSHYDNTDPKRKAIMWSESNKTFITDAF